MRDPEGYLIKVGQYTEIALDWFNNRSSSERSAAASGNAGLPGWRIVLLGNHRLLCGDATSAEAVARLERGAISDALFGVEEVKHSTADRLSPGVILRSRTSGPIT